MVRGELYRAIARMASGDSRGGRVGAITQMASGTGKGGGVTGVTEKARVAADGLKEKGERVSITVAAAS